MLKIGHRGAKGHEPENSLTSFKKAIDMGVDYIEFDVWLSKDHEVFVIHDNQLEKTTNGFGKITDLAIKEIN
ncbi:MAG: hypothetical protein KKF44_04305 [Nanoarchaeota archaeon]|nr:hypothetical protein [Nanoarchaeota archaeon]